MTLLEIKTAIASHMGLVLSDLTINGQDLSLVALNQVRRTAELNHDFNFNRKLLTVDVNSISGGSLASAVLYGTAITADISSIVDVGLFDDNGNLIPQEWTTVEESLERQRGDNPGVVYWAPSDDAARHSPEGRGRFTIANDRIYLWPVATTGETIALGIEAYVFTSDWTGSTTITIAGGAGAGAGANQVYYQYGVLNGGPLYLSVTDLGDEAPYAVWRTSEGGWIISKSADIANDSLMTNYYFTESLTSTTPVGLTFTGNGSFTTGATVITQTTAIVESTSPWLSKGSQHLLYASIIHLNTHYKRFVGRQEGNLPPPERLAAEGLEALKVWDIERLESRRRHGR